MGALAGSRIACLNSVIDVEAVVACEHIRLARRARGAVNSKRCRPRSPEQSCDQSTTSPREMHALAVVDGAWRAAVRGGGCVASGARPAAVLTRQPRATHSGASPVVLQRRVCSVPVARWHYNMRGLRRARAGTGEIARDSQLPRYWRIGGFPLRASGGGTMATDSVTPIGACTCVSLRGRGVPRVRCPRRT